MATRTRILHWLAPAASAADEADWDAVYARELPRVYNFFRYRVGDGPVAEDLTSITFEKAWRARARYRRDLGAFSTWLFTIARNVANDHHRQRRTEVPLEDAADRADDWTPEDAAVRREEFRRLSALLGALPARERELLALKYGADLNNREIARASGLSESNVGTILHRTVTALRAKWPEKARQS
jgi:RNA polymerase sigma-70 factor (ECF subfamily)